MSSAGDWRCTASRRVNSRWLPFLYARIWWGMVGERRSIFLVKYNFWRTPYWHCRAHRLPRLTSIESIKVKWTDCVLSRPYELFYMFRPIRERCSFANMPVRFAKFNVRFANGKKILQARQAPCMAMGKGRTAKMRIHLYMQPASGNASKVLFARMGFEVCIYKIRLINLWNA